MSDRKGPKYQLSKIASGWRWFEYPGKLGTFGIINPQKRTVAKCCPAEGWFRHLYGRKLEEEKTAYDIAVIECRCSNMARVERQEDMAA